MTHACICICVCMRKIRTIINLSDTKVLLRYYPALVSHRQITAPIQLTPTIYHACVSLICRPDIISQKYFSALSWLMRFISIPKNQFYLSDRHLSWPRAMKQYTVQLPGFPVFPKFKTLLRIPWLSGFPEVCRISMSQREKNKAKQSRCLSMLTGCRSQCCQRYSKMLSKCFQFLS